MRMIIMGVDPGLAAMGYGFIDWDEQQGQATYLISGAITTTSKKKYPLRLRKLYHGLGLLINEHHPDLMAVEKQIYCQNIKTAMILGQASGMALLAAAEYDIEVEELTPLEIKQSISGHGRAGKEQVQRMVKVLLNLTEPLETDHASDALAAALCVAHGFKRKRLNAALGKK